MKGAMTMTLEYMQVGEYQIPDLKVPETKVTLGKYGQLRRTYLKQHRRCLYSTMLLSGTLLEHLAEVDRTATQQVETAVGKMAEAEGVTEEMKANDPLTWVGLMNSFRSAAEEEVMNSLVYS